MTLYASCFALSSASKSIRMFVLDEADEMLSRGFKDQIYEIFQKLAANTQVQTSRPLSSNNLSKPFRLVPST